MFGYSWLCLQFSCLASFQLLCYADGRTLMNHSTPHWTFSSSLLVYLKQNFRGKLSWECFLWPSPSSVWLYERFIKDLYSLSCKLTEWRKESRRLKKWWTGTSRSLCRRRSVKRRREWSFTQGNLFDQKHLISRQSYSGKFLDLTNFYNFLPEIFQISRVYFNHKTKHV